MQHRTFALGLVSVCTIVFVSTYYNFEAEIEHLRDETVQLKRRLHLKPVAAALTSNDERENTIWDNSYLVDNDQDTIPGPSMDGGKYDQTVIMYNRVPKTGSTSFMGIAYDLCKMNHFNVLHLNTSKNAHVMSLDDQRRFVYNVTEWKEKLPALYHGHVAYTNFHQFGVTHQPIYINLIRDPIERLVSYYYFLRFGDDFRPNVVRKRKGDRVSFDDCVLQKGRDCDASNMWIQIPFFCGQSAECWNPGSAWALEQAKNRLVNDYLVVGVTEQMRDFVAVLETVLPRFFKGATKLYDSGNKSHLRKTANKITPHPDTIDRIKESPIWTMENEFYQFALEHFMFVKRNTLLIDPLTEAVKSRGSQFFFEKIRPKK